MESKLHREFLGEPMGEKGLRQIPGFDLKSALILEDKGFECVISKINYNIQLNKILP
jgi:hypothetical protein